jgi:hypothetical protein
MSREMRTDKRSHAYGLRSLDGRRLSDSMEIEYPRNGVRDRLIYEGCVPMFPYGSK